MAIFFCRGQKLTSEVNQTLLPVKGRARILDETVLHTIDNLLSPFKEAEKIYSSETALIEDILNIKKSRHYLQLKYLSSSHEAMVLKVRFVFNHFLFCFYWLAKKISYCMRNP